jgi:hypothetical protein
MSVEDAITQAKSQWQTLPENLRAWAEQHLITPREVTLWKDPERTGTMR